MPRKKSDISFETFWQLYPLHRNRGKAEDAWGKLSAWEKAQAIAAIAPYHEHCKKTGTPIKYAQGWLNERRWESTSYPSPPHPGRGCAGTERQLFANAPTEEDMETW